VGTEAENYVNILATVDCLRNLDIWTPDIGSLACWYAKGRLVASAFDFEWTWPDQLELLRDGVMLARNYSPEKRAPCGVTTPRRTRKDLLRCRPPIMCAAHSRSPSLIPITPGCPNDTADLAEGQGRHGIQTGMDAAALYLCDADPAGANYLVFRDTTAAASRRSGNSAPLPKSSVPPMRPKMLKSSW